MTAQDRRAFLKTAGSVAAASAIPVSVTTGFEEEKKKVLPFTLGLASYTFRAFSLDQTIAMTQRAGLTRLTAKDFHLPMKSSDAELATAVNKIRLAGITLDSCGVIYMKTEDEVEQAFAYANKAGVSMIVGAPDPPMLPVVERFVKESKIAVAIHNHGPTDKNFPSPESVYRAVEKLNKGIGLCIDVGHTARIGLDPIVQFRQYFDRVMDFHLKDIAAAQPDGKDIEVGRGVIDIVGLLREAMRKQYSGTFHFEFEKDQNDPLPGVAESVGYVRGVLAAM